ncbi:GNAT family N-acetyltransferase [Paenarthrobacter sp. C1]|uniref:GNAT family N-acetyltransferase n=1 Tax=Paenarthrobacter sp. C1 TaxID=3400220 RepID=UPI003BF5B1B2
MSEPPNDASVEHWPLFGLRLRCDNVLLRPVQERDLPLLAAIQPPDYEHDPSAEAFPAKIWRSIGGVSSTRATGALGTWSPSSWCLDFAVEHDGALVGVQSLEADDFLDLRTVDSGSWLVSSARGRGVGIAMRTAVLALAFDHLNALAAVTSARSDNAASLGVSRHVGYRDNGVTMNLSGRGLAELTHMRLTAKDWRASKAGERVTVRGFDPCGPWFGRPLPT